MTEAVTNLNTAADDYRELERLAGAAIAASYNGDWTTAYRQHYAHYLAVVARCADPAYLDAYRKAMRASQPPLNAVWLSLGPPPRIFPDPAAPVYT